MKSADHSPRELRRRASEAKDAQRAHAFLDLFAEVADSYEAELGDEYDFDDLINLATRRIAAGGWQSPYHYILVDEFQDVSRGRMKLLAALRRLEAAYFLVGDDWQSVYRFAGSDVSLLRECETWLGPVERRELGQTFRFGAEVLTPSSAFVQRNPAQTHRAMRPADRHPDHGVTVVWSGDEPAGLALTGRDLDRRGVRHDAEILLLGSYRRSGHSGPRNLGGRPVERSTVHAAKGREADYVVVLDLANQRRGFPSQIEDYLLLNLVAPPTEPYECAEELRLFYVALTRARLRVYLLSDPNRPSTFISELVRHDSPGMRTLGCEAAGPSESAVCPRCRSGRLSGSAHCSLRPQCDFRAPACPCRAGHLVGNSEGGAHCTNRACERAITHCPACRSGVLVKRDGRYGPFWGCSRYGADPSCGYTRDSSAPAPIAFGRSNLRARHSRRPARGRW